MKKLGLYLFCLVCGTLFMSQGYSLEKELVQVQTRIADLSAGTLDNCMELNANLQEQNAVFQQQIVSLLWFNTMLGIGFFGLILLLIGGDSHLIHKLFDFLEDRIRKFFNIK